MSKPVIVHQWHGHEKISGMVWGSSLVPVGKNLKTSLSDSEEILKVPEQFRRKIENYYNFENLVQC